MRRAKQTCTSCRALRHRRESVSQGCRRSRPRCVTRFLPRPVSVSANCLFRRPAWPKGFSRKALACTRRLELFLRLAPPHPRAAAAEPCVERTFLFTPSYFLARFAMCCAAQAGSPADRPSAPLLLSRNVFAATDQRAEQFELGAGLEGSGVFDGGIVVAAKDRLKNYAAIDGRARIRLSAGLVSGRKKHCVRFVSERCHGVVAAEFGERKRGATHKRRLSERGAALVSRWKTNRVCIDFLQQTVSYFPSRFARPKAGERSAAHGRNEERSPPLLLQRV